LTLTGQQVSLATSSSSFGLSDQQSLVSAITLGAIGPILGGGGTGGLSTASLGHQTLQVIAPTVFALNVTAS